MTLRNCFAKCRNCVRLGDHQVGNCHVKCQILVLFVWLLGLDFDFDLDLDLDLGL